MAGVRLTLPILASVCVIGWACSVGDSRDQLSAEEYAILEMRQTSELVGEYVAVLDAPETDDGARTDAFAKVAQLAEMHSEELRKVEPPEEYDQYHRDRIASALETSDSFSQLGALNATAEAAIASFDQGGFENAMEAMIEAYESSEEAIAQPYGQLEEPLALTLLWGQQNDPLATYLVQAYELDQTEGPPTEQCLGENPFEYSEIEFNEAVASCTEPLIPEAEALDRQWQTLTPPGEAREYHQRRVQLSLDSTEQLSCIVEAARRGDDFSDLCGGRLTADWMRLLVEWNELAMLALSR